MLTGIYWASISAAKAPKGRFCPDFLSFVVQFWAKIVFSPNIGVWGVQIIATERPAHTSLLQPIWNHPAQGNGQKQAKKGSFGPKVPLLVALEALGGRREPGLVTTVTGCSACVGLMVITHFGLILGLFWPPRTLRGTVLAQNAAFWPNGGLGQPEWSASKPNNPIT